MQLLDAICSGQNVTPDHTTAHQRLFDETRGSIVLIETDTGSGTGFFIDQTGSLLTARHVVDRATRVECVTADGRRLQAQVRSVHPIDDLALLSVAGARFKPLKLGESLALCRKEPLVSVTHQLGNLSASLAVGQYRHHGLMPASSYRVWSSSLTRSGSSGGPIMQGDGTVVSVVSAGDHLQTVSIPIERAIEFLAASDSRFKARHRANGWLADRAQHLSGAPVLGLLDATVAASGCYASYLLATRLPRTTKIGGAVSTAALGYSDYENWSLARSERESCKFGFSLAADAAMLTGFGLTALSGRARIVGLGLIGVAAVSRLGAEFYPTRTVLRIQDA